MINSEGRPNTNYLKKSKRAEYMRTRRARRYADGLCASCAAPRENHVHCKKCLKLRAKIQNKCREGGLARFIANNPCPVTG